MPTTEDYQAAFDTERHRIYPLIAAFEHQMGAAISRTRLEAAARVLACPVKAHPPCWQHGRLIYAAVRAWATGKIGPIRALDIGTAKGFSALCLYWAIEDAGAIPDVVSVDVIDPAERVRRNTVAEVDALQTLAETLRPWPESAFIQFERTPSVAWLEQHPGRLPIAFIDGKHSAAVVAQEAKLLLQRQERGDLLIFDDVHLDPIAHAITTTLQGRYHLQYLEAHADRAYLVATR